MENWELFEYECCEFLNEKYKGNKIKFKLIGGHDSHANDIIVIRQQKPNLFIECKMPEAQCGQFVLFVDNNLKKFIYSPRNKTPNDKYVQTIVSELDNIFDQCCIPSLKDLPIPKKIIYDWVKNYYKNVKGASFIITKGTEGYIIIPIDNIDYY